MQKKHLAAIVLLLVILVLSFKVYKKNMSPATDFSALHAKDVNYRAEIQLAKENNQPLFLEFYGEF